MNKKRRNYLLWGIPVLILIIFLVLSLFLNRIVKSSIETYGPKILQVPVTLEEISLSPLSGSGQIKHLKVGNPEGFRSDHLISVGELRVDLDLTTIFSNEIIIENLVMRDVSLMYERQRGVSNFDVVEQNSTSGTTSEETMIIRHLLMENSQVTVYANLLGERVITVKIPRIERENIGKTGTTTIAGTLKEVLQAISEKVTNTVSGDLKNAGQLKLKDKAKGLFNKN